MRKEQELISLLRAGDTKAFSEIFQLHSKGIMRFCLCYIKNVEDAEEVVEDVFISLWENRKNIRSETSVRPFLVTCARNKILNLFRKKVNSPVYEEYVEVFHSNLISSSGEKTIEYYEFEKKLMKIIDTLPPTQKKVLRMSRFENLSNSEIAQTLHLNVQTVKNALSSGLKILRESIKNLQMTFLSLFI